MDHLTAVTIFDLPAGGMSTGRVFYRFHQFWSALHARPASGDLERARALLSPVEFSLFSRLQPSEQAHSLRVLDHLQEQGETHPALLAAALLHDAGKSIFPLRIWERILIVLFKATSPRTIRKLGLKSLPPGKMPAWRRPFIISTQHPGWGAEMAARAGSSSLVEALIRRHQEKLPHPPDSLEDQLLTRLQAADDQS